MTRYNTLLLDRTEWDLVLDSSGNIAMATPPYALAQDVTSAVKLFLGELWYNQTKGIPYFDNVLGHLPPTSLLISYIENAARSVSGVKVAKCVLGSFTNRVVTGKIYFIDEGGLKNVINF